MTRKLFDTRRNNQPTAPVLTAAMTTHQEKIINQEPQPYTLTDNTSEYKQPREPMNFSIIDDIAVTSSTPAKR